jgi:hypothetical protein
LLLFGIKELLNSPEITILSVLASPNVINSPPNVIFPAIVALPDNVKFDAVISPLRVTAEPEIVPTICKFPLLGSISFTNVILSLDALLLPTCIVAKVLLYNSSDCSNEVGVV